MSRYVDFYLIGELVDSHGNVHYEDLKNLPTADVVEVVRCKNCSKKEYCRTSNVWAVPPSDDWFCADGERREDDKGND